MSGSNLNIARIKSYLDKNYRDVIDVSDVKDNDKDSSKFYSRAVAAIALTMKAGIEKDMASSCITDGFKDSGIDAIYNDEVQKKLILVQAKWRNGSNKGVGSGDIAKFIRGADKILKNDLRGCNEKIQEKAQEIQSALEGFDYTFDLVVIHMDNNKIEGEPREIVDEFINKSQSGPGIFSFTDIALNDVYDFLASGQKEDLTIEGVVLKSWGMLEVSGFKSYYSAIDAKDVGIWYQKYGNKLFAKNIRYYRGSTEVNEGMKDLLINTPERFYCCNNGIKILCKKVTQSLFGSSDRDCVVFKLEGVSIINGAQTTGVLGAMYKEDSSSLSKAKILVQIIEIGDADEESVKMITRLSNTQNKIESKDFASLDPNQDRLKKEFSMAGIQYLYKTGAEVVDSKHQIVLDEAIVAQACGYKDVALAAMAKRNVGALTENINKQPYTYIFNEHTNSCEVFNNVMCLRFVDLFLKEKSINAKGRHRLLYVHANRFLLHLVLEEYTKNKEYCDKYFDLEHMEKDVNRLCKKYCKKIYDIMESEAYRDAYPAYLFKNSTKLKEIKGIITNQQ